MLSWVKVIDIPNNPGSDQFQNLRLFLQDTKKFAIEFFNIYTENQLPLAILSKFEGGFINAIGKIQSENRGYINFSNGSLEDINHQVEIANEVIDEKLPFYIDGTSAFFLSDSGFLEKLNAFIPNLKTPHSVINFLVDILDKFRYSFGQLGNLGIVNDKLVLSSLDEDSRKRIIARFSSSIRIFENESNKISAISNANKHNSYIEREIDAELCDGCILARNENNPLMTEDYLYLNLNKFETHYDQPEYFSSLSLVKSLYLKKLIKFSDYLDYFSYLSSYRFRFLSISPDDLYKSVFGDETIRIIEPKNLQKFNFKLTLAENYGVRNIDSLNLIISFLMNILIDDSILINPTEMIFYQVLNEFPTTKPKDMFGIFLINMLMEVMKRAKPEFFDSEGSKNFKEKIQLLTSSIQFYSFTN